MTPIYHFTHIANLEGIFRSGALLCDGLCRASGYTVRDIAYSNLKDQRSRTLVEVPPGGDSRRIRAFLLRAAIADALRIYEGERHRQTREPR